MGSDWRVEFERTAKKSLDKLDGQVRIAILGKLSQLCADMAGSNRSTSLDVSQLKGQAGHFRLRVGDWRVILRFEHDRLVVLVIELGHRSEIYRSRD